MCVRTQQGQDGHVYLSFFYQRLPEVIKKNQKMNYALIMRVCTTVASLNVCVVSHRRLKTSPPNYARTTSHTYEKSAFVQGFRLLRHASMVTDDHLSLDVATLLIFGPRALLTSPELC